MTGRSSRGSHANLPAQARLQMNSRRFRFVTVAALQVPLAAVMKSHAFLPSCEAAVGSLLWFFHRDWLLRMEIPESPERVLAEVPLRHSGIRFPVV